MKKTVGLVALLLVVILAYSFGTRKATNSSASVTTSRNAEWYEKARTLGTSEFLQNLDEEIAQVKVRTAKTRGLNSTIPFILVGIMMFGFFASAAENLIKAAGENNKVDDQNFAPNQPYIPETKNATGFSPWEKTQQQAVLMSNVGKKLQKRKPKEKLQIGNLWYTLGIITITVVITVVVILL